MARASNLPIIKKAILHDKRLAIIDEQGKYTYAELLTSATKVASCLLGNRPDLLEARVAFMVPSSYEYIAAQWGIWLAGGIAVPLCITHPLPEIAYVLKDTAAEVIVAHPEFENQLRPLANEKNISVVLTSAALDCHSLSLFIYKYIRNHLLKQSILLK